MSEHRKAYKHLVKRLEVFKKQIAGKRNALRDLVEEAEGILESCDKAELGLEEAIDALSEYL